jgi:hypothetical protein
MMTNRLGKLLNRTKEIYQEKGLLTLIKRIFIFVISPIIEEYNNFYVYELPWDLEGVDEADYLPKVPNITYRTIETVQQLGELSNEGFDLSPVDIEQFRRRLQKGAILSVVFVDREVGHTSWTALNEEAKKTFNRYPYKVDFANNECCTGDSWTSPKYRRQGLNYYSARKKEQYVVRKGAIKNRSIVLTNNIASMKQSEKMGAKKVAKAHYIRIFGLKFWRERPVQSTNKNKESTAV